jgi:hypothetical protein
MAKRDVKDAKGVKGAKPTGRGIGGDALPSVANHPRAGAQVARAKAWGGLGGFLLVAFLSWRAGVPTPDALLRAVAGGIVVYLAAWACAIVVWRHLVIAELRAVRALAAKRAQVSRARADEPGRDG